MKFKLLIASDNAAMVDDPHGELARILRYVADCMENRGMSNGMVSDTNGNKVGTFILYHDSDVEA